MSFTVQHLQKGGWLLQHDSGARVQHIAPPETIKDTMTLEGGVPFAFLIGDQLCDPSSGVSISELEFPAYFNFFVRKTSTTILCTKETADRIRTLFEAAVFGPQVPHDLEPGIACVLNEMRYFRGSPFGSENHLQIDDFLQFLEPDSEGRYHYEELLISPQGKRFRIQDATGDSIELPMDPDLEAPEPDQPPAASFDPPAFGITVIGSGHGFDAQTKTCGFLIWANRKGILVDPPIHTTHWVRDMGLNASQIQTVILTHCHADHDAGTLQKILEEGAVELVTTQAIHEAFLMKGTAMSGRSREEFSALYRFNPVTVDRPFWIEGLEFRFRYSLHSVPTVGFEAFHAGTSFIYTSDHLLDPRIYQDLKERGDIDEARLHQLMNFPWHHPLIFHEAGVPPLHTPLSTLEELPAEVRARIRLLHVSPEQVKPESGLQVATPGLENTLVLKQSQSLRDRTARMLEMVGECPLFNNMPIEKAAEWIALSRIQHFREGQNLIEKGSVQKDFFFILQGTATVYIEENGRETSTKVYSEGDYIGETAIVMGIPRTARVVASRDLECAVLGEYEFMYFIRGTDIAQSIRNLYNNRQGPTWDLLQESPLLSMASFKLKNHLQTLIEVRELPAQTCIADIDSPAEGVYLIESGMIEMQVQDQIFELHRADFAADPRLFRDDAQDCRIRVVEKGRFWFLSAADVLKIFKDYPGMVLRMEPGSHIQTTEAMLP